MDRLAKIVLSKYIEKKKTDKGNTVYIYSEGDIKKRNKEKAERIEKFSQSVEKLRKKVKEDLKSDDQKTRMTALAVGLIDHTYERVGNDESADEGHYGVTGWTKSHISFSGGGATIKYVGKSGVDHEKKVTDSTIAKALKAAYDEVEGKDGCIFEWEGGCVKSKDVNSYLKDFDVTAKDLRGFHANRTMQEELRNVRKGELPKDDKERTKKLKEEFKKALEATAETVGHEPATLKNQYLVPGMEEAYLKDGTVIEKMTDKLAMRVAHLWDQG